MPPGPSLPACWCLPGDSHLTAGLGWKRPVQLFIAAVLRCAARREKELAAVKVTQADIDVIASEAEVDKKLAERRLREHDGNLVSALKSFL